MRLHAILFLAAAVSGLPAGSLLAQTAQAPYNPAAKKALDPNEVVCEKQEILGSRLATKKVCMTRSQWADLKSQDRQEIERVQTRRGMQDR